MKNISETKQCVFCGKNFSITDKDEAFYERVRVPNPLECNVCRERRRLTFRNEKNLYLRNCESCGKQMVSIYSHDKIIMFGASLVFGVINGIRGCRA